MIEIWQLKYQRGYFKVRIAVLLFVIFENVHLSSSSCNFWMQPNISMWSESSSISTVNLAKKIRPTIPEISNFSWAITFWRALQTGGESISVSNRKQVVIGARGKTLTDRTGRDRTVSDGCRSVVDSLTKPWRYARLCSLFDLAVFLWRHIRSWTWDHDDWCMYIEIGLRAFTNHASSPIQRYF